MSELIDTSKHEKQVKKFDRKRERELNDIKKLVSLVEGRRFLWRILSEAGIYRNSFTGNSTTFYAEGRRSVGLFILEELMRAKPEAFAQMQQEYYSETRSQEVLDKIDEEKEKGERPWQTNQ